MKIILGSSSQWRQQMLKEMGLVFEVITPDIDEKAIRRDNAHDLVLAIAQAKTDALLPRITEPALLITSDQVAMCHGEMREKPESEAQEKAFLTSYATFPAETVTGVVVTNIQTGKQASGVDVAKIYFDPIPDDVVRRIIEQGDAMLCCGGFITDGLFEPYVRRIEGAEDSVIGLPKALTKRLLEEVAGE